MLKVEKSVMNDEFENACVRKFENKKKSREVDGTTCTWTSVQVLVPAGCCCWYYYGSSGTKSTYKASILALKLALASYSTVGLLL